MGARLALQVALHRPDLFSGLILESGTFGIEVDAERRHVRLWMHPERIKLWGISPIF